MFNPDSPNEKKDTTQKPSQIGNIEMSEKQKLKYYLLEGGMASCYGFRVTADKHLEIADLAKLNRFDSHLRSLLRELYLELKK